MIINNPNLAEVVSVLIWVFICLVFVVAIMILVMKYLFDYIHEVEIKLIAQTSPEHKALTMAYFNKLYEAHKKEKDYDKRLDKMFEDERRMQHDCKK